VAGRIAGLAVVLIGLTAAGLARRLPAQAGFGLGPAFLPFWTALVLVACGVWIALRPEPLEAPARALVRAGVALAVLVGYALVLEPVGYLASTAAFLAGDVLLLDPSRPGRAAVTGLAGAVFLLLVFRVWLRVPLPGGRLGW
jgi:putative tricarboxylic transport membrane protein